MQAANIPENESDRLESLHSLNILDTLSEERFDRLTRLARHMFHVPIALVTMIDENRQWFKSCVGLSGVTETDREVSFCGHAILGDEPFVINDAKSDIRFADNPFVIGEPFIRFYAGCPLKIGDNYKLGTLCIVDTKPRILDKNDLIALQDLAALVEKELEASRLATIDELTKISNRRGFAFLAQQGLELWTRNNLSATLVFIDLNQFKPINDKFGHAEGDRALITFAYLMKSSFRNSDVIGRLGGDEFAVLLTGTDLGTAVDVIKKFREAVNFYNRNSANGYELIFSEGAVQINPGQSSSIELLLDKADSIMYEKKKASSSSRKN